MLAQEIDFHDIFKIHPTCMVLLDADLVILDANDEFLSAMGRKLEDLIGRNFYDEFPKLPEGPGGRAVPAHTPSPGMLARLEAAGFSPALLDQRAAGRTAGWARR